MNSNLLGPVPTAAGRRSDDNDTQRAWQCNDQRMMPAMSLFPMARCLGPGPDPLAVAASWPKNTPLAALVSSREGGVASVAGSHIYKRVAGDIQYIRRARDGIRSNRSGFVLYHLSCSRERAFGCGSIGGGGDGGLSVSSNRPRLSAISKRNCRLRLSIERRWPAFDVLQGGLVDVVWCLRRYSLCRWGEWVWIFIIRRRAK